MEYSRLLVILLVYLSEIILGQPTTDLQSNQEFNVASTGAHQKLQKRAKKSLSGNFYENLFVFSSNDPNEKNPILFKPVHMKLIHKSTIVTKPPNFVNPDNNFHINQDSSNFNKDASSLSQNNPGFNGANHISNQDVSYSNQGRPNSGQVKGQLRELQQKFIQDEKAINSRGFPSYSGPLVSHGSTSSSSTFSSKTEPEPFESLKIQEENRISSSKSLHLSPFISRFSQYLISKNRADQAKRPVEFRSYIAVPGEKIQKVSGSPYNLINRRISTNHGLDNRIQGSSSQSVMTIIPAVVRKLSDALGDTNARSNRVHKSSGSVFNLVRRVGKPYTKEGGATSKLQPIRTDAGRKTRRIRIVRQPGRSQAILILAKPKKTRRPLVNDKGFRVEKQPKSQSHINDALFNFLPNLTPRNEPIQELSPPSVHSHQNGVQNRDSLSARPEAPAAGGGDLTHAPAERHRTRASSTTHHRESFLGHLTSRSDSNLRSGQQSLDSQGFASNEFLIL